MDDIDLNGVTKLEIPPRVEYTRAALDFVEKLAEETGFDRLERQHVRLAMDEVLDFIYRSALEGQDSEPVKLFFNSRADGLVMRVVTRGLPLDIGNLPGFAASDLNDESEAGTDGLGLHLARSILDDVVFRNRGRGGMEVEMLKRRSALHVRNRMDAAPQLGPKREVSGFSIRPARDDDAIEISRCAYLTYGYTYEDFIYYPERIIEMNRSGAMRSLVAVADDGAIMGHSALKFADGRCDRAELGVLFVRPEYRKHRIGGALWRAVMECARTSGIESLFARSVTAHRASQSMASANGFHDCAMALALFPRSVYIKAMGGLQKGKMSGMLQMLFLQPARRRSIYPPKRHAAMIGELYARAGIEAALTDAAHVAEGVDDLSSRILRIPVLNVAMIELESFGPDLPAAENWVLAAVRRLCREKIDAIYLYLNIEREGADIISRSLLGAGFIFAGIAPNAFKSADALVLQYLDIVDDPFEEMTVWTDTAKMLRDYIRAEWLEQENGVK